VFDKPAGLSTGSVQRKPNRSRTCDVVSNQTLSNLPFSLVEHCRHIGTLNRALFLRRAFVVFKPELRLFLLAHPKTLFYLVELRKALNTLVWVLVVCLSTHSFILGLYKVLSTLIDHSDTAHVFSIFC
jgi:hypothetical protein